MQRTSVGQGEFFDVVLLADHLVLPLHLLHIPLHLLHLDLHPVQLPLHLLHIHLHLLVHHHLCISNNIYKLVIKWILKIAVICT
jgi:hypothetical protein